MATVRVKEDVAAVVFDVPGHEHGLALTPDLPFEDTDAVVKLHPEFFTKENNVPKRTTSAPVEQATAAPGEKRAR